jgi:hypothetical protein
VALLRALENSINSYFHRASTAAYQLPYGCQPVDRLTETGSHRTAATAKQAVIFGPLWRRIEFHLGHSQRFVRKIRRWKVCCGKPPGSDCGK